MNRRAGFTLVEIMIVVAIIGLLAAIAIPAFMKARKTAQRNACINNLRQIDGAKDEYALEYGGTNGSVQTWDNLVLYIKDMSNKVFCPAAPVLSRGVTNYAIGTLGNNPTCSVLPVAENHSLLGAG